MEYLKKIFKKNELDYNKCSYLPNEIIDKIIFYRFKLINLCEYESELTYIKKHKHLLNQSCWDELCKHKWAFDFVKSNLNHVSEIGWKRLIALNVVRPITEYPKFESTIISDHIDYIIYNNDNWEIPNNIYNNDFEFMNNSYISKLCQYEWALPLIKLNYTKLISRYNNQTYIPFYYSNAWRELCKHEWALKLLQQHNEEYSIFYNWNELCNHKWALPLIEINHDKLFTYKFQLRSNIIHDAWAELCKHEWALPLLMKYKQSKYYQYYDKTELCKHEWALPLIGSNIKLHTMCKHEWALPIIRQNIHKLRYVEWYELCNHEWALPLIENNINKLNNICFYELCKYEWAFNFIKTYTHKLDKTCLYILSMNTWSNNYSEIIKNQIR